MCKLIDSGKLDLASANAKFRYYKDLKRSFFSRKAIEVI
jgi:hypothetical protein